MHLTTFPRTLAAALAVVALAAACGDDDTDPAAGDEPTPTTATRQGPADTLSVTASEYAFAGLPAQLDAGGTTFELLNDGEEIHELAIFRRNDGTTQSIEELLSLPDDQVQALLTPVTETEQLTATPGERTSATVQLEAGDHIAVCFVPVGLTDFADASAADAPPHAAHGMVAEFSVR